MLESFNFSFIAQNHSSKTVLLQAVNRYKTGVHNKILNEDIKFIILSLKSFNNLINHSIMPIFIGFAFPNLRLES